LAGQARGAASARRSSRNRQAHAAPLATIGRNPTADLVLSRARPA
jgi:hypothetical protein